jgi:hypothetical protein
MPWGFIYATSIPAKHPPRAAKLEIEVEMWVRAGRGKKSEGVELWLTVKL